MGGWLLLLCLNLTVFLPFRFLRAALAWFEGAASWPDSSLQNFAATIITLHYLGLAFFCFVAGLWLWTYGPRALVAAKVFLIVYPSISLAIFAAHFFLGFAVRYNNVMALAIGPLLFSTVWFSYLTLSRRVKATYCS